MNKLGNILVAFGPRLLGLLAAPLAGWLVVKTKGVVQVDPDTLIEVGTAMIGTYAGVHRVTSSKFNKGDAATGRMADAENHASDTSSTVIVQRKQ